MYSWKLQDEQRETTLKELMKLVMKLVTVGIIFLRSHFPYLWEIPSLA